MKLINLTPHIIAVRLQDGSIATIPPSGTVARVSTTQTLIGNVYMRNSFDVPVPVPIRRAEFGDVNGLPDPEPETFYVVSSLVASAAKDRPDVIAPDTYSGVIRDDAGNIVAVTQFCKPV